MRTTIDLPPELMRAAKVKAAERGESLKDLVSRAVAHEVDLRNRPGQAGSGGRVGLPLVGRGVRADRVVTNEDIEAALEADDVERYGGR